MYSIVKTVFTCIVLYILYIYTQCIMRDLSNIFKKRTEKYRMIETRQTKHLLVLDIVVPV